MDQMAVEMHPTSVAALRELLTLLELPTEGIGREIFIQGTDPVVPSRYRIGLASAAALAAQAVGAMEIWKKRGGRAQTAIVDLQRAAVPGLRTTAYQKRDGRQLRGSGWPAWEKQIFFRTKDGRMIYLMRHGAYPEHLSRLLNFLKCPPDSEAIARAVLQWNAQELEDALAERRLMGVIARTRDEWLKTPHGSHMSSRVPIEIEKIGDSDRVPFKPGKRPLDGIRILDMAHVLAGPVTARVMAEQGADVLHVSAPHQQDSIPTVIDTGFGKRNTYIDLNRAEDQAIMDRLVREADVFLHSWRPGTLDRRGLSPSALAQKRPGIIYVSVSCYGYDGPWVERAGYDPLGQVASGYAAGEGSPDEPLMAPTFWLNDYLAAYLAAAGANAALLKREREGGSYHVKVSLTSASMYVQQLGELPKDHWPGEKFGAKALPEPPREQIGKTMTPFGEIEHALPLTDYSETKARWELPPEPAGASDPVWRS
jgi:crotonobetainyl-CoA:carnitine CoA-transferase CaiB-like acyl-CoA transferase